MGSAGNCLNLVGDGDDVHVVVDVEQAFGVKITDAEAERCETMGQLFDVVWRKIASAREAGLRCPSAVAFYRLRAGLRGCGLEGPITPDFNLAEFFRQRGAERVHSALRMRAGLELPDLVFSFGSRTVLTILLGLGAALSLAAWSLLPLLVAGCLAAGLAFILPRALPRRVASMRDFTLACTAWNYSKLAETCGGARSRDVWNALAFVVRESSGTGYAGPIDRNTRFFPATK